MARFLAAIVNVIIGIAEAFLVARFLLKLLAARPAADFVAWVYATSEPLLESFRGMFPAPVLEGGSILEFSTLFAILAYAFLGYLLSELLATLAYAASRRRYDRYDR